MALYISANCVYLNVLPLEAIQHAPEDRVATAAMKQILGPAGVGIMAAAIMVSCFGCVNGLILAGARVYYAMSLDGLFFRKAGTLGARHRAPVFALAIQGAWAMLLTLSAVSYTHLDVYKRQLLSGGEPHIRAGRHPDRRLPAGDGIFRPQPGP